MTFQEIIGQKILDEMIEVVRSEANVPLILGAIGYPRRGRPKFPRGDDTTEYWIKICTTISSGELASGNDLQPLVDAIADRYPSNPVFQRYRSQPAGHGTKTPAGPAKSATAPGPAPATMMPAPAGPYDAFLSYSRRDRDQVVQIYEALKRLGFQPWMDLSDLVPGAQFAPELERRLSDARIILVCIGKGEIGPWQQFEINAALNLRLIPISRWSPSCSTVDAPPAISRHSSPNSTRSSSRTARMTRMGWRN